MFEIFWDNKVYIVDRISREIYKISEYITHKTVYVYIDITGAFRGHTGDVLFNNDDITIESNRLAVLTFFVRAVEQDKTK